MKQVDAMLLMLVGILAIIAFLNRGQLGLSAQPSGTSFSAGFTGPGYTGR